MTNREVYTESTLGCQDMHGMMHILATEAMLGDDFVAAGLFQQLQAHYSNEIISNLTVLLHHTKDEA